MNYLDLCSLFDLEKAEIALLSTYEFDPIFFEHRLLNSRALGEARRILIFADYGRFIKLMSSQEPARHFNERYLVVPCKKQGGVYHPKLCLLLYKDGASILCGSSNLTQAGYTHNLELLNAIHIKIEKNRQLPAEIKIVNEVINFYHSSSSLAVGDAGTIARKWLEELPQIIPWLSVNKKNMASEPSAKLVHSFQGPLWNNIANTLEAKSPSKIFILSPFYDPDLMLLKKLRKICPKSTIEITAQQHTGNLKREALKKISRSTKLYDLESTEGRKLHAKLIAFINGNKARCISGSANFTSAAFSSANVEACFDFVTSENEINGLFKKGLKRRRINIEDFESGNELPPSESLDENNNIVLLSVILDARNHLIIQYEIRRGLVPELLSLDLKRAKEDQPFRSLKLYYYDATERPLIRKEVIEVDENTIGELKGAVRCYLTTSIENRQIVSVPYWLVQESSLTYEKREDNSDSEKQRQIQDSGRGLTEHIEYLAKNEGIKAVIEYLMNLNLRYFEGTTRVFGSRGTFFRPHDPSRADVVPEWIQKLHEEDRITLEQAYFDFADRQIHRILQRHAQKGNINGIRNFMDAFITICKMMYKGYKNGILLPLCAMERICHCIYSLTEGHKFGDAEFDGYLNTMIKTQAGNKKRILKALKEVNALAHLQLSLFMAQEIRWKEGGLQRSKPVSELPIEKRKVQNAFAKIEYTFSWKDLERALDEYLLFNYKTKDKWLSLFRSP